MDRNPKLAKIKYSFDMELLFDTGNTLIVV